MTDEITNDHLLDSSKLSTADVAQAGGHPKVEIESMPPQIPAEVQSSATVLEAGTATAVQRATIEEQLGPLFSSDEANNLRARWDTVQAAFVDEPRQAVQDADNLIATTMKRLAEIFADERQKLEHQWDRGDAVSTEDLRLALRRYRSFFSRLLKV
jgi:hypothetical protein